MRKDALIRQLMEQNKMLLMAKEKQEVEMNAQDETLEASTFLKPIFMPFTFFQKRLLQTFFFLA
jgi:ATP phosphoribosyltransferase